MPIKSFKTRDKELPDDFDARLEMRCYFAAVNPDCKSDSLTSTHRSYCALCEPTFNVLLMFSFGRRHCAVVENVLKMCF